MQTIGLRLRAARLKRSLTQREVAGRIGVSHSTICRYERGDIEPSLMHLRELGAVLRWDWRDAVRRAA